MLKIVVKTHVYLLAAIIFVSAIVRITGLETFSPPLNRDEAGIGYNAYSMLKTGKDEHGVSWPTSFESIGDYKMPGYIYLTMLPVKLFGLEVASVRLWSAIGGVVAVVGLYFLSLEIFKLLTNKSEKSTYQALIPTFLLAINPWHIHYSRLGFEANVNLTLFIWSLWFLLKGFKDAWFFIGTAVLWVGMEFMYSSTFIFLPVFILLQGLLWLLFIRKKPHFRIVPVVVALLLFCAGSVAAFHSVAKVSQAKSSITIFSDPTLIDRFNHLRGNMQHKNALLAKFSYNKLTYFGPIFADNYIHTFLPGFLFQNQVQHPWHAVFGQGFFYWFDGLFFIVGAVLFSTCYARNKKVIVLSLFLWLIASPVASAVTIDAPHATRALYLLPVFLIVSGYGLWHAHTFLSKRFLNQKTFVWMLIITMYTISFIKAAYMYLIEYPKHWDTSLFAGIKNAVQYAEAHKGNKLVYMTDVSSSTYLYHLFYNKVDPVLVHQAQWKGKDTAGLTHIESIGQWRFVENYSQTQGNCLLIDRLTGGVLQDSGIKQFSNPATGTMEWGVYER